LNKQTINLITLEFPPNRGGAGVYCEELSYAASKIGFKITIWAPKNSNYVEGCKIIKLPFNGSQSWFCSLLLILILRRNLGNNDILHFAEPAALLAFIRFGWLIKGAPKIITTIHGSELLKFTRKTLIKKLFLRIIKKTSRIHVLSNYNEHKVTELFTSFPHKNIVRLPGGVPRRLKKINNSTSPKPPDGKITLLCVGRIHPRKGQYELLEAINKLPNDIKKKIRCKFIGPFTHTTYSKKVRMFSEKIGCEINFCGNVSDEKLRIHYESADLFALTPINCPKSVEGFGFVYLEASYHGIPTIGHKVGGVEDAVLDECTGYLAEPDDRASLTKIIEKLVCNESLREKLGQDGHKWAKGHCWQKVGRHIYKKLE
jgi:phosphatidylinositol alpha-1,6-mannosyltransferase